MSDVVDKKVVEMQFDNRNFEKNTKQSIQTLNKLNDKLKMTDSTKGLEKVEEASKKVTFDEMNKGVTKVQASLSKLQVASATVISRITNDVMSKVGSAFSFASSTIKEAGKQRVLNIQQAKFQFEGLKMDVEKSMKSALDAVDQTAYGLDEAALVASQLGASGIKAGKDMTKSLKSVAGLAAMTGSAYSDIGRIFTQVAGQGRMMGDDILQISQRGINAAATIAQFLNKSEKDASRVRASMLKSNKKAMHALAKETKFTEASIREMVSAGVIDFETFSNAMDDAFGKHAKDANKTFVGSMANLKSAFSRIGADYFDPIIKNQGPMVKFLNAARVAVNGIHESAMPLIKALSNSKVSSLETYTDFLESLQNKDGEVRLKSIDNIFKSIANVLGSIHSALVPIKQILIPIKDAFDGVFDNGGDSTKELKKITSELKSFTEKIRLTSDSMTTIKNRATDVFKLLNSLKGTVVQLTVPLSQIGSIVRDQFGNSLDKIFMSTSKSASDMSKTVDKITSRLSHFSKNLIFSSDNLDRLRRLFKGLFSVAELAAIIVLRLVNSLKQLNIESKESSGSLLDNSLEALAKFGDLLVDITSAIEDVVDFTSAIELLNKAINSVGKMFDFLNEKLSQNKKQTSFITKVIGLLESAYNNLKKAIEFVYNDLKETFDPNADVFVAMGVMVALFYKIRDFKWKGERFTSFFSKIAVNLKYVIVDIRDIFDALRSTLLSFNRKIKSEIFKNTAQSLLMLAAALFVIASIKPERLVKAGVAIAALLTEVTAAMKFLGGTSIKSIYGLPRALQAVSTSVLILSFALKNVSSIDSDKLVQSIAAIGALITMMGTAAKLMSGTQSAVKKFSLKGFESIKSKEVAKVGTSLILFSAAIVVLSKAMERLAKLSWEEIEKGLTAVGGLILELGIFIKNVDVSGFKTTSGVGILLLAAALYVLSDVVDKLSKIKTKPLIKGLSGILVMLLGISKASRRMSEMNVKAGVGLVLMAKALEILGGAVGTLGKLSLATIAKGLTAVLISLVALVAFTKTLPSSDRLIKLGVGLILVSASLKVVSKVLQELGSMSVAAIAKSLITFTIALGELAIILNAMSHTTRGAKALLVASAGLIILSKALTILGKMSVGEIVKSLATLAGALIVLGAASAVFYNVVPAMLAFSGAIALAGVGVLALGVGLNLLASGMANIATTSKIALKSFMASLDYMANEEPKVIANVVLMVTRLLQELLTQLETIAPDIIDKVLGIVVSVLDSLAKKAPEIVDKVITIIIGVVDAITKRIPEVVEKLSAFLQTIVGSIIGELDKVNVDSIIEAIKGFGLLMGLLAVMSYMVTFVPKALVTAVALGVILLAYAKIFSIIGGLPTDAIEAVDKVSLTLLKLSGLMKIISLVPIAGAVQGIAGLAIVIAGITAILAALGKIEELTDGKLSTLLEGGGNIMELIGQAIGKFIGGLIGGIASGVADSLPDIATKLSEFMQNLDPFISGLKQFDGSLVEGGLNLVKVLLAIAAAKFIDALANMIGADYSVVTQMKEFGKGVVAYSKSVSELTDDDIKRIKTSAEAAKPLVEVAKSVPLIGGALGELVGNRDLGVFGKQLAPFGKGLKDYSESVKDLKDEDITRIKTSAEASKPLVEVAKSVPLIGGFLSDLAGDKDLGKFGEQLAPFGQGLKKYSDSVKELSEEDITRIKTSAEASKALADVANALPTQGGFVKYFTGTDISLDKFGGQLANYGEGLVSFVSTVSEISDDSKKKVNYALDISNTLVDIANKVSGKGSSFWDLFNDKTSLGDFADQVEEFANGIIAYCNGISSIKEDEISKASSVTDIIKSLTEAANMAAGIDSDMFAVFLDNIANTIPSSISGMYENLKSVFEKSEEFTKVVDIVNELVYSAQLTQNLDASSLSKFTSKLPSVGEHINKYYNKISKLGTDKLTSVSKTITDLLNFMSTSIIKMGSIEEESDTFKTVLGSIGSSIKSYYNTIKGIKVKTLENSKTIASFISTFSKISSKAISKFNKKLDEDTTSTSSINSFFTRMKPVLKKKKLSIESSFATIGKYAGYGFSKGVRDNVKLVENSIESLSKKAIKKAREVLGIHSPSKVFENISKLNIDGLIVGIKKNTTRAVNATKGTFKAIAKAAKKESIVPASYLKPYIENAKNSKDAKKVFNANSKALTDFSKQLYKQTDAYREDTANVKLHKKELRKAQKEYAKYSKLNNNLTTKNQKALSANQKQIERIEELKEKASKKDKKRYEEELKTLKAKNEKLSQSADKEKDHNDDVKEKYKAAKKAVSDARKSLEEDEKTILSHMKATLAQYTAETAASIADFVDPFKQSMETGIELFQEFSRQSKISSNKVLYDMKQNVKAWEEYNTNVNSLNKKGFSQAVIDKAKSMGIQGASYIEALSKMTDQQVKETNATFAKYINATGEAWKSNIVDAQQEAWIWVTNLEQLSAYGASKNLVDNLKSMGPSASKAYIDYLLTGSEAEIRKKISDMNIKLNLSNSMATEVAQAATTAVSHAAKKTSKSLKKGTLKKQYEAIGSGIAGGIASGIKKDTKTLENAVIGVTEKTKKKFKKAWGINSPSKVAEKLASYIPKGLGLGISNGASVVINAVSSLSDECTKKLNDTMKKVSESIMSNSDIDDITIKPILDLSDVNEKASQINSLFDSERAISIGSDFNAVHSNSGASDSVTVGETVNNTYYTQNISSPKYLSRLDIYRDTRRLINQHA